MDIDNDLIPDGCDELIDSDFDGVANDIDLCPNSLTHSGEEVVDINGCSTYQIDSDLDGVNDAEDICPGGNDSIDSDLDKIPDYCDQENELSSENNTNETTIDDDKNDDLIVDSKSSLSSTEYLYIGSVVMIIVGSMIFLYRTKK